MADQRVVETRGFNLRRPEWGMRLLAGGLKWQGSRLRAVEQRKVRASATHGKALEEPCCAAWARVCGSPQREAVDQLDWAELVRAEDMDVGAPAHAGVNRAGSVPVMIAWRDEHRRGVEPLELGTEHLARVEAEPLVLVEVTRDSSASTSSAIARSMMRTSASCSRSRRVRAISGPAHSNGASR